MLDPILGPVCVRDHSIPEKLYCQGGWEVDWEDTWSPVGEESKVPEKLNSSPRDMVDARKKGSLEEEKTTW